MRFAWLVLISALACSTSGTPAGDANGDPSTKPASCPFVCDFNVERCPEPDHLSSECVEACYWGTCCQFRDGTWGTITLDCRRPPEDAGVDGAVDAS